MQDILDAYARAATPEFIDTYESLAVETIYTHVIDLFPAEAGKIVDIGAGTGRDAAWFAERGHQVLAVEPVRQLREAGRQRHRSAAIAWLDDRLPGLPATRSQDPFDLVLVNGVWQHLSAAEQMAAVPTIAGLTSRGGRLVLSLRHGPAAGGRRVFPIDPEATVSHAESCGLRLVRRRQSGSVQPGNRAMGVHWTWLVFEKDL